MKWVGGDGVIDLSASVNEPKISPAHFNNNCLTSDMASISQRSDSNAPTEISDQSADNLCLPNTKCGLNAEKELKAKSEFDSKSESNTECESVTKREPTTSQTDETTCPVILKETPDNRPSVIVSNPAVIQSVLTPSSNELSDKHDSKSCSTSASLSTRWAESPDSIIERLRLVNGEHLRVLCRSYITSLVNCPELELMLKEDESSQCGSSRSSNRKTGRRTRTFSLSSSSKKQKPTVPMNGGAIFGNPLTQEGIAQITQLMDFLSGEENLKTEGIFRKSGNIARQRELKVLLDTGSDLCLGGGGPHNFSAHDCANVLKSFLGELPEPLLQEKYYGAHCQVPELGDQPIHPGDKEKTKKRTALQLLFLLLPRESYLLLRSLLRFLSLVASHADSNRMTSSALGTLFAPHLLCPRAMTPTELQNAASLVSCAVQFMIDNVDSLFKAPPELVQSSEMFLRRRADAETLERSFGSPFHVPNENLDSSAEGLLSPPGKRGKRHRRGSTGEKSVNVFGFGSNSAQGTGKALRGRHPSSPAIAHTGPPDSPAPVDPMLHFVDQKISQQAEEGCTRKALQDLYADIQSMPEGPRKKKYIKMMQKNHGLGIPIPAAAEDKECEGDSPPEDRERRGRKHSRSRSFGEALGNFKRALSRGRHQRSRSSSRSRAAAAAGAATASTVTDENRENDKVSESEGKEAAGEKSPPDRDEDGSPPPKTHRGGPWVHRQHSKGVSGGVSGGSVLSPIAMSPMDHHGHTPVIAASSSPAARKNAALIAASLTGSSTSTPKIPANAVRVLPDRQSQRCSALPSSLSSIRQSSSSPLLAVRASSTSSSGASSPTTARHLKPTTNFSDKLLSLSEQSKSSGSCGTPHGKSGTVLQRGPNANTGMERFRSPLPSKFALCVAQAQQEMMTNVVIADDEAIV